MSRYPSPHDRLTHPTDLVLVLEFDAWFWCVRGRIDLVKKVRRRSCTVTAMFPSPHDRLTHPTDLVLVLVLVLEFDARSWCVRGRIDFVRKVYQRSCMTNVTLSLTPRPTHTPYKAKTLQPLASR